MRVFDVRNTAQALVYITDCNLATVEMLAGMKSKSKGEYHRQIAIAQSACDWLWEMKVDPKYIATTRAVEIVGIQSVAEWAKQYEVK